MLVTLQSVLCLTLGIFLISPLAAQAANYCNKNLCNGKKHIACNNKGNLSAICAKNAKIITLTAAQRTAMVKQHNTLRNLVALGNLKGYKPAMRMATMRWDPELAKLAELNVKQCAMQHDQCRSTQTFKYAGQNLATSKWKGMTRTVNEVFMSQIQLWFDEYKLTNMAIINKLKMNRNFKDYGHFTAMVQEKSTHVGCAILRQTTTDGFTQQFYACNYAYTNIVGQPVYRRGRTASKCSTGQNKTFRGLCSLREKYNVNVSKY